MVICRFGNFFTPSAVHSDSFHIWDFLGDGIAYGAWRCGSDSCIAARFQPVFL